MGKKGRKVSKDWREIAKSNPKVDPEVLKQSLDIVEYIRSIGIKSKGFNILRSSEAKLTLRPPTLHTLP